MIRKNISILGGSFNMVTIGHIQTAQFVLNNSDCSEVWLMPSYQSIFCKKLISSEHRLKMCEIAAKVDARIKVFDYEIRHKLSGETFKLVKQLKNDSEYENYDFSFIMAMDNANSFNKWVNYEHLEKMMKFVVVSRKGIERDTNVDWYLQKPHIFLEGDCAMNVSSTLVRDLLKEKCVGLEKYLNYDVIQYIIKNNLYE